MRNTSSRDAPRTKVPIVFAYPDDGAVRLIDDTLPLSAAFTAASHLNGFNGNVGEVIIYPWSGTAHIVVGLGPLESWTTPETFQAGAATGRFLVSHLPHIDSVESQYELLVPSASGGGVEERILESFRDGLRAGSYRFRIGAGLSARSSMWESHAATPSARALALARDLVNLPPNLLTPELFAIKIRELLVPKGLSVTTLSCEDLLAQGFGGVLGVGRGSANRPALVEITTASAGHGTPEITFVGKAVTYDSGGLSLKAPADLSLMKNDMAGGAVIVALFSLLPAIAPERRFSAVIPIVENLPGPNSLRPGEVLELYNGSTLEIIDTDFEGRVILADALARAVEHRSDAIVDIATLTYSAANALGEDMGAFFTTDEDLARAFGRASERSGEKVWRMPLNNSLAPQIRSPIATYRNHPMSETARSISAALLLREFIPDSLPWAHFDIAGTAWQKSPTAFREAGATGFGLRLLEDFILGLPHTGRSS